tara:strand:- start:1452 stop:2468 length:1017 start_codon:yes stop_codon:yes gene_type:complete
MEIQNNISLKKFNTFGIDVLAAHFCEITSIEDLHQVRNTKYFQGPKLILGGGSNILLTQNFNGLIVHANLKGIQLESTGPEGTIVSAMAGENWHQFVLWTLENNLGGIENLSYIPGNCGTAPMQNIGAYGVEIKDVFHSLDALDLATGEIVNFSKEDCQFGYRESIFKRSGKGKYLILKIYLNLKAENEHILSTSYGAIKDELLALGKEANIHSVSEAVINIRKRKLPNPQEIGNSGSFFKNPVVSAQKLAVLKKEFPEIVNYPLENGMHKLAAGWLIEKAGWKGYRKGDAGVHKNQALVLVNYGNALGSDIQKLSKEIRASIFRTFDLELETEVNII